MSLKSFLFTLAIFCGGYVSNTLLDSAVDAAQTYFHVQTSTYKTDSNGYIICSTEKPKITNDNVTPLTSNASANRPPRTVRAGFLTLKDGAASLQPAAHDENTYRSPITSDSDDSDDSDDDDSDADSKSFLAARSP